MRPQAPCKDCEGRYVGCHSNCESYKKFANQNEIDRRERHREKYKLKEERDAAAEARQRMKSRKASNRFRK